MKKLQILALLFTGLCFANTAKAQQKSLADLMGRWDALGSTTNYMEFVADNRVKVNIPGLQLPSSGHQIDFTKDPIWLDVQLTSSRYAVGLLKFMGPDTIKWKVSFTGERPADFDAAGTTLTFKRKK